MKKKQYFVPCTQAMPIVAIGSLMITSNQLPPDMGAPAKREEPF